MRYRPLGRSGLQVSELCLGTMTFHGGTGMWKNIGQLGQSDADEIMKTAFDGGINFFDTANVYSEGGSEEILGQSLKNLGLNRHEVVIASKGFGRMHEGPNGRGASRYHIIDACKASLKRLGVDHIDLYQLHGFDFDTPIDEQMEALDILVKHGHVRYVGVSNWAGWQLAKAQGYAERRGTAPIRTIQSYYSLAGRDVEREVLPAAKAEGVGMLCWSPLAGGYLSGKYTGDDKDAEGRRAEFDFPPIDKDKADGIVGVMQKIASAKGASVPQIALAWLLAREGVSSVIVGARKVSQLQDNLGATEVDLSDDDMAKLDEASALPDTYPQWMFERQSGRLE
ncbi:Predicted oxidoreductase [Palleronia marisminoris]|uniref:L-glyceraldehyde 3-phosphate reductase n=1 Tax=Palleronia marisminoris TaxID=315423 RepID=A0A1Y5RHF1_9RHOB|nr:aldo/keto reductase [Palleronia marisminoris]SFG17617.1 Predicted oxidoreductase [Palleronia marisminoris]SLN16677.1 L-glyceraldehyde 3-phosphate reductase [Palleronia marisminoris]